MRHHCEPNALNEIWLSLTPTEGHKFDHRVNFFYLYPLLLTIPFNLICLMTMLGKIHFWPPSPTPGAWSRWQNANPVLYVTCPITPTKFSIKNLWDWLCIWNLMIFDLLTSTLWWDSRREKSIWGECGYLVKYIDQYERKWICKIKKQQKKTTKKQQQSHQTL